MSDTKHEPLPTKDGYAWFSDRYTRADTLPVPAAIPDALMPYLTGGCYLSDSPAWSRAYGTREEAMAKLAAAEESHRRNVAGLPPTRTLLEGGFTVREDDDTWNVVAANGTVVARCLGHRGQAEDVAAAFNGRAKLLVAVTAMLTPGKSPADIDAAYQMMRDAVASTEGGAR